MSCFLFLPRRMGALRWAPTVLRMSCSSPASSATPTSASTLWRTKGFFVAAWCAVSADVNCPGASTLIVRTVCDNHVRGSHLLPHSLLPPQSGMVQRFSIVTIVSLRLCSSRTTSSEADLPSCLVLSPRDSPSPLSWRPTFGARTATNDVWRREPHIFSVVLCTPQTTERWNYCTTFWRSSHGCNVRKGLDWYW